MFSFDEFEDMCEKLAEAWQQILMPFEKLSEVLEAIYNDPALWPKRNGVTPKKVRPVSSEKAFAQTVHAISVYSNNSEESPLYEENILAKLREFAPVLSNLR